jgi:TonB family protein
LRYVSQGQAAMPQGDPSAPRGEELWLRTADHRYLGYFQRIYARVKSQWVFPPRLARELVSGEVVVSFTIRKSGRVDDIAVRKSSGFREFDENVIRAVERAAPLPPIPDELGGKDLRVNAPFEYLNPLVR